MIGKAAALLSMGLLCLASGAQAAGTSGAAFLKVAAGARPSALGEAYTALADDVNAVAWNPAGLTGVTSPQFTATQGQMLQEFDQSFVAGAYPFPWGTLGFGVTSLSVDGIEKRAADTDAADGTFGAEDTAYNLSYARRFGENLSAGVSVVYLRQALDGRSASAMGGNLGLQWVTPHRPLTVGLALRHLGTKVKFDQEGDPLPMTPSLGAAWRHGRLNLTADVRQPRDEDVSFGGGAEFLQPLPSLEMSVAVRGGYNSAATDVTEGMSGVSAGFGVTWRQWGFDMAWAPYGALGQTFRYALIVKF
jgi:hypothetical protein